jgi:hypothetical protein
MNINPLNHNSIYIGSHNILKSVNAGGSFTRILIPPAACDTCDLAISAFRVAPTDTNTIYVAYQGPIVHWDGYQQRVLFKSQKSGDSLIWTDLTDKPGSLLHLYGITSIEVSPDNDSTLWISFGGFWHQDDPYHHRVLFSPDGGKSWNNDTNYSKGLPNCPVNCLKYLKGGNDRILAGTDRGVFYRDNDTPEWQPFNTGSEDQDRNLWQGNL